MKYDSRGRFRGYENLSTSLNILYDRMMGKKRSITTAIVRISYAGTGYICIADIFDNLEFVNGKIHSNGNVYIIRESGHKDMYANKYKACKKQRAKIIHPLHSILTRKTVSPHLEVFRGL